MPTETPFTNPVPEPIVATAGLLLVQLPPAVASARVVVEPMQIVVVPVMGKGGVTTFTVVVEKQAPEL